MSYINSNTKELVVKVVCVGDGARDALHSAYVLSGPTHPEPLQKIDGAGGLVSHFVFAPPSMRIGQIDMRLHLYAADKLGDESLLSGTDVVVFTASSSVRNDVVVSQWNEIRAQLLGLGHADIPAVFQYRSTGFTKKAPSRTLLDELAIEPSNALSIACTLSFEDALAGRLPKKPEGVVEGLKLAARCALIALRDTKPAANPRAQNAESDQVSH